MRNLDVSSSLVLLKIKKKERSGGGFEYKGVGELAPYHLLQSRKQEPGECKTRQMLRGKGIFKSSS